jgi:hypothetical protein
MLHQQNPDGSWSPAEPLGWQEEHNLWQRLVLWVLGREHCNDREGQRRPRFGRRRSGLMQRLAEHGSRSPGSR